MIVNRRSLLIVGCMLFVLSSFLSSTAKAAVTKTPAPQISISASPGTVSYNGRSTLTWSSKNASSCTTSWGDKRHSGSYLTPALKAKAVYTVSCTGLGGSKTATKTVFVSAPIIAMSAKPSTVNYKGTTVVSWEATNVESCATSWGDKRLKGSYTTGMLKAKTPFSISCMVNGQPKVKQIYVSVVAPVVSIGAQPVSIGYKAKTTLSWKATDVESCTTSWGDKRLSGTYETPVLKEKTTYTLNCLVNGLIKSRAVSVLVKAPPKPTITFSASPTSVAKNASTDLSWKAIDAHECLTSWGDKRLEGTYKTPSLAVGTNYSITCKGEGGPSTKSILVSISKDPAPVVMFNASPAMVDAQGTTNLIWKAVNAASCVGSWDKASLPTEGSFKTPSLSQDTVYTMSCLGPSGTTTVLVTVYVALPSNPPASAVVTYPPLPGNLYKSPRYKVTVFQKGTAFSTYVHMNSRPADANGYAALNWYSLANHFTSFSFNGPITVKVELPLRKTPLTKAWVRPLSKAITPIIEGNVVTFTLNSPANIFVDVDGEARQPLLIFANPLETNAPSASDYNVHYFGPGIHDIGISGTKYQDIPAGKIVYLAGGAFVRGALKSNAKEGAPIVIRGRGILSGTNNASTVKTIEVDSPFNSVNIEGITIMNFNYYSVVSYRKSKIENVKILGWRSYNDAPTVGPGTDTDPSVVKNCFFKTNDDNLKLYFSNTQFLDNVIWHQAGAVIQLGWNLAQNVSNVLVRGVDVIASDMGNWQPAQGYYDPALVSLHNINGAKYSGVTIQDVRVESKELQLFAMQTRHDGLAGFDHGIGIVDGIIFKNFKIDQNPVLKSVFRGNGVKTGEIKNISFNNITVAGVKLNSNNERQYAERYGKTSGFTYDGQRSY